MDRISSFPPLCGETPRILILGSMPGEASLHAGQYYAYPRNAFWPIIEALFGIAANTDYAQRCQALATHGVAVWDVLESCIRSGSLDAAIESSSIVPNDFLGFFERNPSINAIYFNGSMAEQSYRRYVLPELPEPFKGIECTRLPSTSPANASYSFDRKLTHWRRIADAIKADGSREAR